MVTSSEVSSRLAATEARLPSLLEALLSSGSLTSSIGDSVSEEMRERPLLSQSAAEFPRKLLELLVVILVGDG